MNCHDSQATLSGAIGGPNCIAKARRVCEMELNMDLTDETLS